jgi:hypothetical protein
MQVAQAHYEYSTPMMQSPIDGTPLQVHPAEWYHRDMQRSDSMHSRNHSQHQSEYTSAPMMQSVHSSQGYREPEDLSIQAPLMERDDSSTSFGSDGQDSLGPSAPGSPNGYGFLPTHEFETPEQAIPRSSHPAGEAQFLEAQAQNFDRVAEFVPMESQSRPHAQFQSHNPFGYVNATNSTAFDINKLNDLLVRQTNADWALPGMVGDGH